MNAPRTLSQAIPRLSTTVGPVAVVPLNDTVARLLAVAGEVVRLPR